MRNAIIFVATALCFAACSSQSNSRSNAGSAAAAERSGAVVFENSPQAPASVTSRSTNTSTSSVSNSAAAAKGAFEKQNLNGAPVSGGSGAQDGIVNSNRVGNADSGDSQASGSNP
jgi:hypothetical protein